MNVEIVEESEEITEPAAVVPFNAQSPQAPRGGIVWTQEQKDLIQRTVAKDCTADEFKLFMYQCYRTGLDPIGRQLYAIKRGGRLGIQTSIDGFRLIAERTGKYAGQLGPFWCGEDGQWTEVWLKTAAPAAAKVAVLRSDFKEPLWAVARWSDYAGNGGPMWKSMGPHMLAKVAEALALRRGFPQELPGLYTSDEMDQDHELGAGDSTTPASQPQQHTRANASPQSPSSAPDVENDEPLRALVTLVEEGKNWKHAGIDAAMFKCSDDKKWKVTGELISIARAAIKTGATLAVEYVLEPFEMNGKTLKNRLVIRAEKATGGDVPDND